MKKLLISLGAISLILGALSIYQSISYLELKSEVVEKDKTITRQVEMIASKNLTISELKSKDSIDYALSLENQILILKDENSDLNEKVMDLEAAKDSSN